MKQRSNETTPLTIGQKVESSGYVGTVRRLYADGATEAARMYEVQMPGGLACICGSDLTPIQS